MLRNFCLFWSSATIAFLKRESMKSDFVVHGDASTSDSLAFPSPFVRAPLSPRARLPEALYSHPGDGHRPSWPSASPGMAGPLGSPHAYPTILPGDTQRETSHHTPFRVQGARGHSRLFRPGDQSPFPPLGSCGRSELRLPTLGALSQGTPPVLGVSFELNVTWRICVPSLTLKGTTKQL